MDIALLLLVIGLAVLSFASAFGISRFDYWTQVAYIVTIVILAPLLMYEFLNYAFIIAWVLTIWSVAWAVILLFVNYDSLDFDGAFLVLVTLLLAVISILYTWLIYFFIF